MKTFTIENETNNITIYGSFKESKAAENVDRFSNREDLAAIAAEWPAARLVEIWNSLPGVTPVKKFKDRATAVTRIWNAIQNLAASETEDSASMVPEEHPTMAPAAVANYSIVAATTESAALTTEPLAPATPVRPQTHHVAPGDATATKKANRTKNAPKPITEKRTREGSKTSWVIELLKREGGVSLKELMAEMGWQSHTTRALMSAGGSLAKKHGLTVVSTKGENGERTYSILA